MLRLEDRKVSQCGAMMGASYESKAYLDLVAGDYSELHHGGLGPGAETQVLHHLQHQVQAGLHHLPGHAVPGLLQQSRGVSQLSENSSLSTSR